MGDTVGDPLKDTSGPALNILMKLMAVESLVLAPFFAKMTPGTWWREAAGPAPADAGRAPRSTPD